MLRTVVQGTWVGMITLGVAGGLLAQETKTLTGEIVDPASYLKDGRHGPEMEDASFEAVDGGQTLALLEDGTGNLYLFLGAQSGEDPNELAYDYVGQQVKVTGAVHERGGLRGIVAESVEPLTPPADTAAAAPKASPPAAPTPETSPPPAAQD